MNVPADPGISPTPPTIGESSPFNSFISKLRSYPEAVAIAVVFLSLIAVYYHGVFRMGLYEDDYVSVVKGLDQTWPEVWSELKLWATDWPNGRPLGNGAALVLPFFLAKLGGLHAFYLIPLTAVILNSFLLYRILAVRLGAFPAFVGAFTFALLPTDTLRLCLHGTPEVQYAITCLLLGYIAYSGKRWWLCYVFLVIGMLFHECATLSFFVIPALDGWKGWPTLRRVIRHAVLCTASIGFVLGVRGLIIHETRTREVFADPIWVLRRMVGSAVIGSYTHLQLLLGHPGDTARHLDLLWFLTVVLLAAAVVLAYAAWSKPAFTRGRVRPLHRNAAVMFTGGLSFTVPYLAYITSPYWPANQVAGRMASVHTAPGVGVAMIVAAVASACALLPKRYGLRYLAIGGLATYLGLLLGWGHIVEQQYQEAWRNQKIFWRSMLPQLRDIGDRTIVFVERTDQLDYPFTWVIGSNSWADSIMLSRIYAFPAYHREPRVFFVDRGWSNQTKQDNGRVFWFMPPGLWQPGWVQLEDDNVIVFRPAAGRPVRVGGVLQTAGGAVQLKAPAPFGEPGFPHRPLYGYLMH